MGTDAIIVSRNKKLACYIDRKYNACPTGDSDYRELESGVTPERAIEILKEVVARASDMETCNKPNLFWTNAAIDFVKTLDDNDTVELIDEHRKDDAFWEFTGIYERIPEPQLVDWTKTWYPGYTPSKIAYQIICALSKKRPIKNIVFKPNNRSR